MNKLALVLSMALLLPSSIAFAEEVAVVRADVVDEGSGGRGAPLTDDDESFVITVGVSARADSDDGSLRASSSLKARIGDDRSATATAQRGERDDDDAASTTDDDNASTTSRGKGDGISSEHRSAVATFVQSLLRVADRDGGIGAQVRAVAQSQNDSASTTAEALAKVEGRSKIWSFFFGTDWKNVGKLRSEIAKAGSDAARLETAIAQATDASVKADLTAQLAALKAEQTKIETFVDSHENSFSLLGWFTKLFVSTETSTSTSATASTSSQ